MFDYFFCNHMSRFITSHVHTARDGLLLVIHRLLNMLSPLNIGMIKHESLNSLHLDSHRVVCPWLAVEGGLMVYLHPFSATPAALVLKRLY